MAGVAANLLRWPYIQAKDPPLASSKQSSRNGSMPSEHGSGSDFATPPPPSKECGGVEWWVEMIDPRMAPGSEPIYASSLRRLKSVDAAATAPVKKTPKDVRGRTLTATTQNKPKKDVKVKQASPLHIELDSSDGEAAAAARRSKPARPKRDATNSSKRPLIAPDDSVALSDGSSSSSSSSARDLQGSRRGTKRTHDQKSIAKKSLLSSNGSRSSASSPKVKADASREEKARRSARPRDKDDLRSDLNAEAFARSTGAHVRKDYRSQLQKFKQARKKSRRGLKAGSEGEDSDDSDSDDSSSSASSGGFIVSDDSIEDDKARKTQQHGSKRTPPSRSLPMHQRAMDFEGACERFVFWLSTQLLSIPQDASEQKLAAEARRKLQDHIDDTQRLLSSSAARRQFDWYLKRYPILQRETLFSDQVEGHRGCAACHRRKQQCDSRIILAGKPYDHQTLQWMSYETDAEDSSEMSTDADNLVEHQHPDDPNRTYQRRLPLQRTQTPKKHVFLVGSHCANRALLQHEAFHWAYMWLNKVSRLPEQKALKERMAQGGRITSEDIGPVVRKMKLALNRDLMSMRNKSVSMSGAK